MERDPVHATAAVTRRQFGVLAASGVASLTLPGCAHAATRPAAPRGRLAYANAPGVPVAVAGVARGAGDEATVEAVRAAALSATDFSWLSRGDTVLIKPVCNSGNPYPATTDPVALRAVIALLREKGAGRVIVADMSGVQFLRFDADRTRGSTRELMRRSGMAPAAEDAGAELHAFEEPGWDAFFEEVPAVEESWAGPVRLPNLLAQADHVVLVPRCSRHLLAGSTLGLKAAVGWWRHDTRLEYHRDASTFSEKTADANSVPALRSRQRLVLTSATKLLTTFGPDDGTVSEPETGLVFASTDVVAHDMVSLAWLIENRAALPRSEREGPIDDPNTSQTVVSFANRVVTAMLGGMGAALAAERLERYDLDSVWDDRVLGRAFEIFGGVPRVELADVGGRVPASIRERLANAVRLPTA
ncbi:MAG: DUF362 domain-containing protein [Deltaproteobacteria bacterium]|nr:MAG: DUF362 domain-containing protein [Deltaproteobacteria bacterium]